MDLNSNTYHNFQQKYKTTKEEDEKNKKSPSPSPPKHKTGNTKMSTGIIVLFVVIGVVFLALLIFGIWYQIWYQKQVFHAVKKRGWKAGAVLEAPVVAGALFGRR